MNLAAVRWLLWGFLGLILLATAVGTWVLGEPAGLVLESRAAPPPILGSLPEFTLTNRDGAAVTLADLEGRAWVADFIFTRCAFSCPRMTARMMRLRGALPDSDQTALVSITVDPENDSPQVLADYAASYGIRDPDWFFLSGDASEIEDLVVAGFKLPVVRDALPGEADAREEILHSDRFVLVDADGRIRGYYEAHEKDEQERLLSDILVLSEEKPVVEGEPIYGGDAMSPSTTAVTVEACAREIEDLHDFFGNWFRARLPATDKAFARFERVLAEEFSLVGPDGEEVGRREILERVRSAHGSRQADGFEIWIEDVRARTAPANHCLMTYQEWQRSGDTTRVRISTVLLRARSAAPNGVEWVHLHETWLADAREGDA